MNDRQKNTCHDWHIPLVLVKKFKGVRATSFKTHSKVSGNHRQWKNIMGQLMYMHKNYDANQTWYLSLQYYKKSHIYCNFNGFKNVSLILKGFSSGRILRIWYLFTLFFLPPLHLFKRDYMQKIPCAQKSNNHTRVKINVPDHAFLNQAYLQTAQLF